MSNEWDQEFDVKKNDYSNRPALPDGEYNAVITKLSKLPAELHKADGGTFTSVSAKLEISIEHNGSTYKIWKKVPIHMNYAYTIKNIHISAGLIPKDFEGKFSTKWNEIEGAHVRLLVGGREWTNRSGEKKVETVIKKWLPPLEESKMTDDDDMPF